VPVGLSAPHISSTCRLACRRFRCQYLYFGTSKASKLGTCVGGWRRRDARNSIALRRSAAPRHQEPTSGQQAYVASGVSICTLVLVTKSKLHTWRQRDARDALTRSSKSPAAPSKYTPCSACFVSICTFVLLYQQSK
jgi:hypothetical protein